jgi:hypothetical protein
MKFEDLIGKKVAIVIPMMHEREFQKVIIHGVEYGGLWIEHESFTQTILEGINLSAGRTPLLFVPYHNIKYALHGIDKIALSEKAFGG